MPIPKFSSGITNRCIMKNIKITNSLLKRIKIVKKYYIFGNKKIENNKERKKALPN